MPFPILINLLFYIITYKIVSIIKSDAWKEADLDYTTICLLCAREKASASAFLKKAFKGSITVEAVTCIPLFLYAAMCLIWMLELRAIQIRVRCALQEAGKQMALDTAEIPVLIPADLEARILTIIGEEKIKNSLISDGIHCEKSFMWPMTGIMELKAEYKVKLPVPFFVIPDIKYEESMRIKAWTGYVKSGLGNGVQIEHIVYVTETGVVYHEDYHCNYLEPSIRQISSENLESLRNENGGKYYPCIVCGNRASSHYYITNYGEKYHSSMSCVGLKRKIYAVPISEVKGKGACSKCGQ